MKQKKLIAGLAVLLILAAAVIWQQTRNNETTAPSTLWQERAEEAQLELSSSFWDEKRGLFSNAAPCIAQLCSDPFNYWWLAHAVDVLTDGYERTGDERYTEQLVKLYQGLLDRNAGVMINDYYDDMEWMALAWLRAYDATKDDRYKQASLELWEEIKGGWNEEIGGGIAWRKEQIDYKNTPANAPAAILAARLYEHFQNEEDLDWAKKIYNWQKQTLVDPDTGLVWDGINRTGDGNIDKDWQFTYGQGVYIGAGVELYHATEDKAYLEDARQTAANLKDIFLSPATGMLPSEGEGDGGLFKGVLVRYVGELIAAEPDGPEQKELIGILETNADSLWQYGKAEDKAVFSNSWVQTPDAVVQLSTELSGIMLLEQMAVLEKNGQLH
ncbi:glycoside hydrolase family 76 protein [Paenibacillus sp. YAF4_2]|uniref:glycoside hydrolase family 76 protein n=1 Tax=Paenibacillus sp. YAF4_2 TaxID=3233085 RepID=UPI003F94A8CE